MHTSELKHDMGEHERNKQNTTDIYLILFTQLKQISVENIIEKVKIISLLYRYYV